MSEIIEHPDDGSVERINVGDKDRSVPLKVYQAVYNQITSRTEQIRQRSRKHLIIEFSDIEQLHIKIMQLCDVYDIIACNESVTVFHFRERKETFSSFERFRTYNTSTTRPTLSVLLKYNFSVLIPGIEKPQEYVVSVRLSSRVGLSASFEEDEYNLNKIRFSSFRFASEPTAEINIEYVDYVVARGFIEGYQEWLDGCKASKKNGALKYIQHYSHWISYIFLFFIAALISYFAYAAAGSQAMSTASTVDWARFGVIYLGVGNILIHMAYKIGSVLEVFVDSVGPMSYLRINKGDDRVIEQYSKKNRNTGLKIIGNIVFTIVLGIITTKLENLL